MTWENAAVANKKKNNVDDKRLGGDRVEVTEEVKVTFDDFKTFTIQYAENISTSGMYLRSDQPLPANSNLHFRLLINDTKNNINQEIAGKAVVVWTKEIWDPTGKQSSGMGLKFTQLEGNSEKFIRDFINKNNAINKTRS